MRTLALFALAALAFSILAGVVERGWRRRDRRTLQQKTAIILHPLARHRFRNVRYPFSERVFYHVGLFFGFLIATYLGMVLLKIVHSFVANWF